MTSIVNVQEWLDQCMSQVLNIWCEDPEVENKQGGGILGGVMKKSFVTYRIKYKQPGRDIMTVRHRYSEFEALRSDLRDRYHPMGILVPPLPPKHSLNNAAMSQLMGTDLQETFVKERLLGLTLFCENVVRIPWLRHDNLWKAFLRPPSSIAMDLESNNIGYMQLLACLQQMELPQKSSMSAHIEGIKEELSIMEKHVKVLMERTLIVQKCERALQQAHEQLSAGLESFHESEKVSAKGLAGRTFNNDAHSVLQVPEMVSATSKGLVELLEAKCAANRHMDFYTGVTLLTILEQELALVDAMKDLIRQHDDLVAAIAVTTNKLKGNVNADQMREMRETLQEKEAALSIFYAGFMYFTLPLAARQRASNMRRFTAGYVSAQTAHSFLLHRACEDFFKGTGISSYKAIDETNKTMLMLGIFPIPAVPATGGDASEGSDDEASSGGVDIIPHVAIPTIRDAGGTIQHMDNMQGARNHHQHRASSNRIPKGLSLSMGSTGMNGLYARALMHDRGLTPNNARNGPMSQGETQINAVKTSEGRQNPLAARRGSQVQNKTAPVPVAPDLADNSVEVDMYGTRRSNDNEYVSLRGANPSAPVSKPKPVNPALLDDLLEGSSPKGTLNSKRGVWEDV